MTDKEMQLLWKRFGESGDYLDTCNRFARAYNYTVQFVMDTLDWMIDNSYDSSIGSWQ